MAGNNAGRGLDKAGEGDAVKNTLYRYFDENGDLLYVGRTCRPRRRQKEHCRFSDWWGDVCSAKYEHFDDHESLDIAERVAIKTENPKHNLQLNNGTIRKHLNYSKKDRDDLLRQDILDDSENYLTGRIVYTEPLMTVSRAAELSGISITTFRQLVESKKIKTVKIPYCWRGQKKEHIKVSGWHLLDYFEELKES